MHINEKVISGEHNLHSSAKFIINTAQPAVGPSRVDCRETACLARKGPLLKPVLKKQPLFIDVRNTTGIFWAKADTCLLFLFLISAATIWDSTQRANECSWRRRDFEAKSWLSHDGQNRDQNTENIALVRVEISQIWFQGFYVSLCGICHFGLHATAAGRHHRYHRLPPIGGTTD